MSRRQAKPAGSGKFHTRMVDKIRETQPYGQALFGKVKKRNGDRALLSFSAGKDALAAALALREHYEEVVPFYMYLVPGLPFVEESLDYYERKLFGRPVLRVPHPSFLRWTKTHLFSDPVKAAIVDELEIPLLSFTDLEVMVRQEEGLDLDCLVAHGRARRRWSHPHDGAAQVRAHHAVEEEMAPDLGLVEDRGSRRHRQGRAQALRRLCLDEALVRRHPRRRPGADQEECAGRLQADPRMVPAGRG